MSQMYYSGQVGLANNTFMGYVQDDQIYRSDMTGNTCIGVVTKVYDELKADYESIRGKCQKYYDKLVEAGIIKPELTGDALIKKQAEQLDVMARKLDEASQNQERLLAIIERLERKNEFSFGNTKVGPLVAATVEKPDKRS